MKTIYKYPISVSAEQMINLPLGAYILKVGRQQDNLYLWALVDTERPVVKRKIIVHGTGHDAADVYSTIYIDSVELLSGKLIFHIFDAGEQK